MANQNENKQGQNKPADAGNSGNENKKEGNDVTQNPVTNPKYSEENTPQVGGVTTFKQTDKSKGIFETEANQPVRDREPDDSKGTPVKRFFTKEGTPVEPTSVPNGVTPASNVNPDENMRDDVVAAWEYKDKDGNTVTHDALKREQESKNRSNS